MLNRRARVLVSLALSLAIMSLASGCGLLKKDVEVQTEAQTQTETQEMTETETEEKETELKKDIAYTSQDKTIRITLPDSTWKVTQDADEMRVFSSGSAAMINIVHATDDTAMKNLTVARSEQELTDSLTNQYPAPNAFEVVEFETRSSSTLNTYEYVIKYNSTSMWAYSVIYGIIAEDEAYVISGSVTDDNKVLLEAVKQSVESFTVLRNSAFGAIPGTVVNQSESGQSESSQSESSADASAELNTLTDYGTTAELYANDNVNIRLEPSTEAEILGSLAPGDKVTVVGETAQWFKVNIYGNIGYINKAFLVNTPTQTEQTDAQETQSTTSSSTMISAEMNSYVDYGTSYQYFTTTDVNLRSQPGTDSSVVNTLGGGTAVSVIGETDNWFVVSVNGATGYISKSYISSSDTSGSTAGDTGGSTSGDAGGSTGGDTDGSTGGDTGGSSNTGTGVVTGTITNASATTITVQGDDGNTYVIDTSDAALSTADGIYTGLYISATIDYSNTTPSGELYATSVTGN